jgi:hypothetical protein
MACGDERRLVEPLDTCESPPCTAEPPQCETPPCPVVWRPSGNPHRVDAIVQADHLVIEAGTVVEFGPAGGLKLITLEINGAAESPVQLRASSEGGQWRGIDIGPFGSGVIRHALIDGGGIVVGNSAFRVEHTTIRRAAGPGIWLGRRTVMYIRGGVIEDNGGTGITTLFEWFHGSTVVFEEAVRITRNGGYPLAVPLVSLRGPLSEEHTQAMLTGNARDTIRVFVASTWGSHRPTGDIILRSTLPVHAELECGGASTLPSLTMLPGSELVLSGRDCTPSLSGPRFLPEIAGTANDPVMIRGGGLTLTLPAVDTAHVRHARLADLKIRSGATPLVIEDSDLDSVTLLLTARGSRIARVRSARGGSLPSPDSVQAAVTLGSSTRMEHTLLEDARYDAVLVTGDDVVISNCTIRGSAGHGVRVEQGSARVEHCNLEANTGDGVHNVTTNIIDARYNWWGDAAGPLGASGDGVSANVLSEPYATAPLTHLSFARRPAAPPPRSPVVP